MGETLYNLEKSLGYDQTDMLVWRSGKSYGLYSNFGYVHACMYDMYVTFFRVGDAKPPIIPWLSCQSYQALSIVAKKLCGVSAEISADVSYASKKVTWVGCCSLTISGGKSSKKVPTFNTHYFAEAPYVGLCRLLGKGRSKLWERGVAAVGCLGYLFGVGIILLSVNICRHKSYSRCWFTYMEVIQVD